MDLTTNPTNLTNLFSLHPHIHHSSDSLYSWFIKPLMHGFAVHQNSRVRSYPHPTRGKPVDNPRTSPHPAPKPKQTWKTPPLIPSLSTSFQQIFAIKRYKLINFAPPTPVWGKPAHSAENQSIDIQTACAEPPATGGQPKRQKNTPQVPNISTPHHPTIEFFILKKTKYRIIRRLWKRKGTEKTKRVPYPPAQTRIQ